MISNYNRLKEVHEEGIVAIDTYVESINKFTNILKARKASDCRREVQYVISQNQSRLLSLCILKNIKRKKIELLKKKLYEERGSRSLGKFVNIKINLTDYYKEHHDKLINIKISLTDYYKIKGLNKQLKIIVHLDNCNKE